MRTDGTDGTDRRLGVDVAVFVQALLSDAPRHREARHVALEISAGLSEFVIVAPAIVALVETLVRMGAGVGWASERADDVQGMCRVVDVGAEDVARGLEIAADTGVGVRVAVTSAALSRHGVARVVAFDAGFDRIPGIKRLAPGAASDDDDDDDEPGG